jgi:hypothetical protein
MFTEYELKRMGVGIPSDLQEKTEEFWSYVEERLGILSPRIARAYIESVYREGKDTLNDVKEKDPRTHRIVTRLIDRGAIMTVVEDRMLVLETESWSRFIHQGMIGVEKEMLEESLGERSTYISERISETLEEGRVGVLFIDKLQTFSFPSDIRVIRMMPFDPRDYLQTWLVSERLREKEKDPTPV